MLMFLGAWQETLATTEGRWQRDLPTVLTPTSTATVATAEPATAEPATAMATQTLEAVAS